MSISTAPIEAPPEPAIAARARAVSKVFGSGETAVQALDGVDVAFPRGRFTAIMGPSGSGKSTLLYCMAGLEHTTSGEVYIGDVELSRLKDQDLTVMRRERIGFIFQAYNLVPTLNAEENMLLPLAIAGRKVDPQWFNTVVDTVGMRKRLHHRPTQLSGGQQQRVAAARAFMSRPDIVFADEPSGNLDSHTGAELLGFMRDSVHRLGQTIVMVTHDPTIACYSDHVLFLKDGRIVDELADPTADAVLARMKSLGD
jgi:putative ABC transport system ATP-binding protein